MRGRRFIVPIAASAALVLSAPFIGQLRAALQDAFPGQYTRIIAGVVFGSLAVALVAAMARIRERRALRYGAIASAVVIGTTYALISRTGDPTVDAVERFHFVEYGLIALLFYRAWRPVGDSSLLVLPVLAGLLVGIGEEWLQWFVPSRVGELRDVFLNLFAIGCGLLFSVALDPPERLAPSLRHESWTRIRHATAVVLIAFGVFLQSVHLGYRIDDATIGQFRSAYTREGLAEEARLRAERWRANPPLTWARLSREDQFLTEAATHVRKRNQCWDADDFTCAWRENLILERYFAVVLDTPTYHSTTGLRWPPEQRDNAALEAGKQSSEDNAAAIYISEADDPPIFVWPKTLFWALLGIVILAIIAPWRVFMRKRFVVLAVFAAFTVVCGSETNPVAARLRSQTLNTRATAWQAQSGAEAQLEKRARAIHERVITLDTHNDINPANFTAERNYTQDLPTQVNLPKMFKGGLDASFFIVYVGQGPLTPEGYADAYKQAIAKFDAIHRLTKEIAPDKIELALTAADVRRIAAKGKKVALIGIENAYPIGTDLSRIKEFYDRGGRYMSLAHNGHSQFSDSNTGERDGYLHNGLSELGRKAVAEMNSVGIMVDVSHPSKQSMLQTVALSKAPIIASHSSVRALANHSRNMDDEQLLALKKNGGVIQMVALAAYVKVPKPDSPERAAALQALRKEFGLPEPGAGRGGAGGGGRGGGRGGVNQLPPEKRAAYEARLEEINKKLPGDPRATVQDFVNHIDYAVKLLGIDHVGISSDFDGGGGVTGWNDASETFNVTLELVRRGYTEPQIAKIWSGNLLRVMAEVEKIARAGK